MPPILRCLHCEVSTVQSAFRPRPVSAAIRLNLPSVLSNIHNCYTRSELELRGPRIGLKCRARNSR
eukprot:104414-Alexandrium_andersonii.AAC.1